MTNDDYDPTLDEPAVRSIAQTTYDIFALAGLGFAAYQIGKLAYDGSKFGIAKLKERKNQKD